MPIDRTSSLTTIGQWVIDPHTGSKGVALREAKHDLQTIPLESGYERVEVMVLFPQEHHKLRDIVIWDVKSLRAKPKGKMEAIM